MTIYSEKKMSTKLSIKSTHLNNSKEIDNILENNLKEKVGNKCIKDGYVRKKSIKIVNKSIGKIPTSHFNGTIIYTILYTANLCCPQSGEIIECIVININKMGILAETNEKPSPLTILIAHQHHIDNDMYLNIKKGQKILVQVMGAKFEIFDKKISVISKLVDISKKMDFNNDSDSMVAENNSDSIQNDFQDYESDSDILLKENDSIQNGFPDDDSDDNCDDFIND